MKNIKWSRLFVLMNCLTLLCSSYSLEAKSKKRKKKAHSSDFYRNYGMAGCGLGSIVMGKDSGQLSAATTNGSTYNQLLGISFGTLNCLDEENERLVNNVDAFMHNSTGHVAAEAARRGGENLLALSKKFGCSPEVQPHFNLALHKNFEDIFSAQKSTMETTDSIIRSLLREEKLVESCRYLPSLKKA